MLREGTWKLKYAIVFLDFQMNAERGTIDN